VAPRRARVVLSELILPRAATVRSVNMTITNVPYVWCFVRQQGVAPAGDQSVITYRLSDPDRVQDAAVQPPAWTTARDTLWFLLTIPGARIPGDARYLSLSGSNAVQVVVTGNVGASLPEFCVVLPSGEVVDFQQYDDNIPVPAEGPQDAWACISALLTVQFEVPPVKRQRNTDWPATAP
jgi:hypothetical protein